jgi:hypothetical protein
VKNLFRFQSNSDCNTPSGSPKLVPSGGGISASLSKNFLKSDAITGDSAGMIDVVNGFYWTNSQLSSRQDIPAIMLKEKRLKTNSLIAQLAYYTAIASEKGGEVTGRLANLASTSAGSGAFGNFLNNTVGRAVTGIGQKIVGAASNFGKGFMGSGILQTITGKSASGILGALTAESASSDVLAPYEGLYITEDTKFVYKMPYFSDAAHAVLNAFGNEDKVLTSTGIGSLASGALNQAEKIIGGLSLAINPMEPGIYIEKPQFYQFAASGEKLRFTFPLINTGWATFEDVQRNWQLIYMLVYQNRPNRKSRDLIEPPCLYEVMIPGIKYMPYAYVSTLSVNFMGSRRSYYVNVPSANGGTSRIQTIIPDAYMVTVELTSLIAESRNFLYHMLFEKQNKVNVLESSGVGIIDDFLSGFRRELNNDNLNDISQKTNKTTQVRK